jgi:hypothetical protein
MRSDANVFSLDVTSSHHTHMQLGKIYAVIHLMCDSHVYESHHFFREMLLLALG